MPFRAQLEAGARDAVLVRLGRRDDAELLPLELDDGEPAAPADAGIVEVGGRAGRRWRDLLLVIAAVALVATIGVLGDDGGTRAPEADAAPTTSIRRFRTSTTRAPVTTTVLPVGTVTYVEGHGPLTASDTGSAVAWVSANGRQVSVLDLDDGVRCTVAVGGNGGSGISAFTGRFALVQTNGGEIDVVASDCSFRRMAISPTSWFIPGGRPGATWRTTAVPGARDQRLIEVDLASGMGTGRVLPVPERLDRVLGVEGGVVVGQLGSVTYVPVAGRPVDLGNGTPIAAGGDRVAVVECHVLRCDLTVRDLGGRLLWRHEEPAVDAWQGAVMSSDGRWLAYQTNGDWIGARTVLVDTARSAMADLGPLRARLLGFTAAGRHLLVVEDGAVAIRPLDGSAVVRVPTRAESVVVLDR